MNSRNPSLDVLRGIAVLTVLVYHYQFGGVVSRRFGWAGVDLFFVLSGFLVSGLMFREFKETGEIRIGRFLLRRGLKIWPAFYFYLAIMALMAWWSSAGNFPHLTFLHAALFLRNYAPGDPLIFDHTWSLALEEHFYLLLAIFSAYCARKKSFAMIPALWVILSLVCLVARFLTPVPLGLMATHCRMDALFTGVTISYLYHFRRDYFDLLSRTHVLPVAALCLIPAVFLVGDESRFLRTFGLTVTSWAFALLLAWSVNRNLIGKAINLVAWIGVYSYSIYLWQFVAAFLTFSIRWWIGFPLFLSLAVLLGVMMAKLVEMPVLRLRDRLLPSRSVDLDHNQALHGRRASSLKVGHFNLQGMSSGSVEANEAS